MLEEEGLLNLYEHSLKLALAPDLKVALDTVLEASIAITGADYGNIQILNLEGSGLVIVTHRGFEQRFLDHFKIVPLQEGSSVCGRAAATGGRVIVEDVETDPAFEEHRDVARSVPFRAVQSTPLLNAKGELLGMLSTHFRESRVPSETSFRMLDLYALQAAVLIERIRLEQKLQMADQRKDEFLAMLAHELRNPLASIQNAVHILQVPQAQDETRVQACKIMERQLSYLKLLVDDLTDVSRVNHGKFTLKKCWLNLDYVIQRAIETVQPLIKEKRQELVMSSPGDVIHMQGDLVRLTQIFINLLTNACKYTDEGGRITLTVKKEQTKAMISVRDNGIGIPGDRLAAIFDMFVQAENALAFEQGGMGLGLPLVNVLVQLHGGQIKAYSEGAGQGSEFVVFLPLA